MNIEMIAFCDAATDSQGKLNILGAFDCIWSMQAPIMHAQCAVALRIRFDRIEEGDHRIRINVIDADGKSVMPSLNANMKVVFGIDQDSAVTNLILNIHQLKLDRFGPYAIDVAVDGRQETSLPFFVRQLQKPASNS